MTDEGSKNNDTTGPKRREPAIIAGFDPRPPPGSEEELAAAMDTIDRIHERTKGYPDDLRTKATELLMRMAFPPTRPPLGSHPALRAEQTPLEEGPRSLDRDSPASFGDLVQRWRPGTQPEWVLLAAYFLTKYEGTQLLTGHAMNKILRHHGTRVLNITRAISYNVDANPATMLQVKKDGTSKQARKSYRITTQGMTAVEGHLLGSA